MYTSIIDSIERGRVTEKDAKFRDDNGEVYREYQREVTEVTNGVSRRLQGAILLKGQAVRSLYGSGFYEAAMVEDKGDLPLSRPIALHTPKVWGFDRDEAMREVREEKEE